MHSSLETLCLSSLLAIMYCSVLRLYVCGGGRIAFSFRIGPFLKASQMFLSYLLSPAYYFLPCCSIPIYLFEALPPLIFPFR